MFILSFERVWRTSQRGVMEEPYFVPFPLASAWKWFAYEECKVGWDGYLSCDDVLYRLPTEAYVAGSVMQVRKQHGMFPAWLARQLAIELAKFHSPRRPPPILTNFAQ